MRLKCHFIFLCFFASISSLYSQTTDLAITLEAQDLNGNSISQAHYYERYSYLVTISNTGAPVSNADFSVNFSSLENIESAQVQNVIGGASNPNGITIQNDTVTGILPNMPNSASVEILIIIRANVNFLGGATATAIVNPPSGTADTNPSTNSSIISIIMTAVPIDFQINQIQTIPSGGAGITNWGDTVTYEITITNNSTIEYPIENFDLRYQNLNGAGSAIVTLESLSCIASNGMSCPALNGTLNTGAINTAPIGSFYTHNEQIVFDAGASFTLEATYKIEEGDCSNLNPNEPLELGSRATILLPTDINNVSPTSDLIETDALTNIDCPCTDLESVVTKVSPLANTITSWNDIITFDYTFSNNGPLDINGGAFLINSSNFQTDIEILSATCINTTGSITCNDINITITPNLRWITDEFLFPSNSSVTVRTTVRFIPPDCTPQGLAPLCSVRGAAFENDPNLIDCDLTNNISGASINGLNIIPCVDVILDPIIELTELQTSPNPNTAPHPYGNITYEIVMKNVDTLAHRIKYTDAQLSDGTGILQSIVCTGTTGGATCPTNLNANIGVSNGAGDLFWQILDTDGIIMPANSSITFEKVINWKPICDIDPVSVSDNLSLFAIDANLVEIAQASAGVGSQLVSCVDLVVQTYPSVTSSNINESLEWIIDVTNSNISDDASNLVFNDLLHPDFVITGTPTCTFTSGNATCISNFTITGNQIDAIIPFMEANSTIQIRIPVNAPSYGGSFENRAEAQPDFDERGENTPDSNISTSSLFVLTTQTTKSFDPAVITSGETSILTFTLVNSNGQPAQNNISFVDNLPAEITLSSNASWENQNGASGTFIDVIGSSAIGIQDLSFPQGTDEISFSVEVTSSTPGFYVNDFTNFSNLNNIDVSTAFSTLEVLPFIDLAIEKTVDTLEPDENGVVTFTITIQNLGNVAATIIIVEEFLPSGYSYISHTTSDGVFDNNTGLWNIPSLNPGELESLEITVSINIPGDFINVVTVYSDGVLEDMNLENNTASAFTRPDCLKIPEGFSPNNDGVNDTLVIECLELYPDNEFKIFNRYGDEVFIARGYLNDWDGRPNTGLLHNNSTLLPTGTYFWYLNLNDGTAPRVGWIYINY